MITHRALGNITTMTDMDIPQDYKTSLPPRKRAKTKEEKEQRRIERILRNRKAAHASREKKRKHVEFLESYVLDLEKQLHLYKDLNTNLMDYYTGGNGAVDNMVEKVQNLPDLKKMRQDHLSEIDVEDHCDSMTLPKTPESFTSSPKNDDDFVPELMSPESSSSVSDSNTFNQGFISPETSPISSNKFSLDIITGAEHGPSSPVKIEPELDSNKFFTDNTFIKKEEQDYMPLADDLFSEKLSFDDFQVNTLDNDYGFDELRNPAVITHIKDLYRVQFKICQWMYLNWTWL